jgi:hypothetical protein
MYVCMHACAHVHRGHQFRGGKNMYVCMYICIYINAGNNSVYNLSVRKMKEEKRPTFATIFDKFDARSKKLNPKNPLNANLTNDQMFRYYLEETGPMRN